MPLKGKRQVSKIRKLAEVVGSNPTRSIFSCYRTTVLIEVILECCRTTGRGNRWSAICCHRFSTQTATIILPTSRKDRKLTPVIRELDKYTKFLYFLRKCSQLKHFLLPELLTKHLSKAIHLFHR